MLITEVFDSNDSQNSIKELLEQLWEYQEAEANLLVEIATLHYENEDTEDAIAFLEKAADIYHELEFTEQEAVILDLIGDVYNNMDDVENALDYYKQSFRLTSKIDTPLKEEVLNKIKSIEGANKTGKTDESYREKILDFAPSSLDSESQLLAGSEISTEDETIAYEEIGKKLDDIIGLLEESAVYGTYQKFDNPMGHVKEAYEMASSIGDEKGEAALLLIMGDISLKNEKTKKSLEFFTRSLNLFRKIGDEKGEAISRLMIGTAHFLLGETDEGSVYLRQSMEIIKYLKDRDMEKAALALLKSIYG
ncbi:MAG: tetratricopeptide repeat protein [Methanobacteriaceae archaeon]|nr:tetratricopeptide repeat protein [Methanobacteriaceae archaeon]